MLLFFSSHGARQKSIEINYYTQSTRHEVENRTLTENSTRKALIHRERSVRAYGTRRGCTLWMRPVVRCIREKTNVFE